MGEYTKDQSKYKLKNSDAEKMKDNGKGPKIKAKK